MNERAADPNIPQIAVAVDNRRPFSAPDRRRHPRGGRRAGDVVGGPAASVTDMSMQLATISHELRTPLNAIKGWLEILQRRPDEATFKRVVGALQRSTDVQTRLIEDLIDLGRMTVGQMRLDLRPVPLRALVLRVVEMLGPAVDAKGLHIQCEIDDAVTVAGDALRLEQVFWNVLVNAVKFTPAGGGGIEVRATETGDMVEITVADSGVGIPADVLPTLFEPFRQGSNGPSSRGSGLGIGLAITRHLVEMHSGTIAARNAPSGGSVFTITLPRYAGSVPRNR